MIKVKEDAEYIFKYQRYSTVLDFASRNALPPPLSVFGYIFDWIAACYVKANKIDVNRRNNLMNPRSIKLINKHSSVVRSNEAYSYWKGLTKEFYRKKTDTEREKRIPITQMAKSEYVTFDLFSYV